MIDLLAQIVQVGCFITALYYYNRSMDHALFFLGLAIYIKLLRESAERSKE